MLAVPEDCRAQPPGLAWILSGGAVSKSHLVPMDHSRPGCSMSCPIQHASIWTNMNSYELIWVNSIPWPTTVTIIDLQWCQKGWCTSWLNKLGCQWIRKRGWSFEGLRCSKPCNLGTFSRFEPLPKVSPWLLFKWCAQNVLLFMYSNMYNNICTRIYA